MKKYSSACDLFSSAKWIWPESHHWDIHNSYALFRKEIVLARLPAKAPLFITADQSYQLYINGEYVCRGPARGFQKQWPFDEVDVRRFLRKGKNVLAVQAHNPGFSNFQYISQRYAGLLVAGQWGTTTLVSDNTWKARRQHGVSTNTVPTSVQLFCQEHIDLREEDPGWMLEDFDDEAWKSKVEEHPFGGMPWESMQERGIPMLDEEILVPKKLIGTARGRSASNYMRTRDVAQTRFDEGLKHQACTLNADKIISAKAMGKGGFISYLIDFEETVVGSVGFQVQGAKGGELIDTLHVETIDAETLTPLFVPGVYSHVAFGHRLICRSGTQTHTFYHPFGFRYMVVTLRDSQSKLTISPFLRTTLYPLKKEGLFASSDSLLNSIWKTCARTQRVCSLDAYVDTPWREQAQWWGDARVQAKNTFFYSGDARLFRRGIAQIAGQTTANGLTYGHAPTMAHICILPDFTLIWLITLWDYYWQTGSLEPFLAHEETIKKTLQYFESMTDTSTGLVAFDKRYWLFLDWTGLFKEGYSTVYNFWLLIALDKLGEMYRRAKRSREAGKLEEWAKRLRSALARLEGETGLVKDGLGFDRKPVKETSIHSQTLAIISGLHPATDAARIEKVLLPFIRGEVEPEIVPSSYWITYVLDVLTETGHGNEVVDFIREKWAPMVAHGTTWETFKPQPGDTSYSHAWSAHPLSHLMETIGGVRQTAPGWRNIIFEPVFTGKSADVLVPTPLGKIRSSWVRKKKSMEVRLVLPKGISAVVRFPGQKPRKVTKTSTWNLPL